MNEWGLFQATKPIKHRKDKQTDTHIHAKKTDTDAGAYGEKTEADSQSIRLFVSDKVNRKKKKL